MPKVTAVVVGAGLAGLSAAYGLARDGIDVVVVERGDYPGSKSITGGRLYFHPVKDLFPELWEQAPWERRVVKETLTMVGRGSSVSLELFNQKNNQPPYHSFTLLSSVFNRWLAQQVSARGARIITKYKVDDLVLEQGRVRGVIVGGSKIEADVVVAADGVMSRMAEKAGLRGKLRPQDYAIGIKEVIDIPAGQIEERFGLGADEGAAKLFIGSLTRGMMGAGFLYTNRRSVSLGLVLGIADLAGSRVGPAPFELLEGFKALPEIAPLIRGGQSVEYAAHVLSESGLKGMPALSGDGILVAGDAAGMTMNLGVTVRGMDFAIASGALAARAIAGAKKAGDFSAGALGVYQKLLDESFVGRDFKTFRHAPELLANPRLFNDYPQLACQVFESLMAVGDGPKPRLSTSVLGQIRQRPWMTLLKDVLGMRKI